MQQPAAARRSLVDPAAAPRQPRRVNAVVTFIAVGVVFIAALTFYIQNALYSFVSSLGSDHVRIAEMARKVLGTFEDTAGRETRELMRRYLKQDIAQHQRTLGELEAELAKVNRALARLEALSTKTVLVDGTAKRCVFGTATVIAPRKTKEGASVSYWHGLMDSIPKDKIQMVAVLNKLGEPLKHSSITHVLEALPGEAPEFDEAVIMRPLQMKFGDSIERVKWRSNIVLDFIRIVRFVTQQCRYALWIEDDAILKSKWFGKMERRFNKFLQEQNVEWTHHFVGNGMPGVLINSHYAEDMLQYMAHHFDDEPVDWIIGRFNEYMRKRNENIAAPLQLNLVGHRGAVSSLEEAEQRPVF